MKKIKKILSCTLIAMLLFSCENNNNDDSTEAVQSSNKDVIETKTNDRKTGEMIISYTDNHERLHIIRGTDYTDRLSYSMSKDGFQIFDIGLYLDYQDLPNVKVLSVKEDQVVCSLEDIQFTLYEFKDGIDQISFEAKFDNNSSIPFTVQLDSISKNSVFEVFRESDEIENPFREMANAKLPWIPILKEGIKVMVSVGVVILSEAQRRCSDRIAMETANCNQKKKCARKKGICSVECIECPK